MDINKIVINLWFDTQAAEAADLYMHTFGNSRLLGRTTLTGTPSGEVDLLTVQLEDLHLMLMSAGPAFKINPSISFMVSCGTREEVKRIWDALIEGGRALMPLDKYDFNEFFGWVEDRFGVSWQILLTGDAPVPNRIRPMMLFTGKNAGRAEAAIRHYTSVLRNSEVRSIVRHGPLADPETPDMVLQAEFVFEGQSFIAMDSAFDHAFGFNEAVSIVVNCDTQEEIDRLSDALSADPDAEQCGWVRDRFGVSWQLSPAVLNDMMREASQEALDRVTQALLPMKRIDIATLERAYRGE